MAKKQKATETPTSAAEPQRQYALDRTVLANERTYAAWIRTGLAALVTGVATEHILIEVYPSHPGRLWTGHRVPALGKRPWQIGAGPHLPLAPLETHIAFTGSAK